MEDGKMTKRIIIKKCLILFLIAMLSFSVFALNVFADDNPSEEQSIQNGTEEKEGFDFFKEAVNIMFSSVAFVLSLVSLHRSRSETVRMYYDKFEGKDYKKARDILYSYRNIKVARSLDRDGRDCKTFWHEALMKDIDSVKEISKYNKKDLKLEDYDNVKSAASLIANFYQEWGILCRKRYLPMWVFDSSAGYNLIRLYLACSDFIKESRKQNVYYAKDFQWLCEKVYEIHTKKGLSGKSADERYYRSCLTGVRRWFANAFKKDKYAIDISMDKEIEFFGFETGRNENYINEKDSFAFRSLYSDAEAKEAEAKEPKKDTVHKK